MCSSDISAAGGKSGRGAHVVPDLSQQILSEIDRWPAPHAGPWQWSRRCCPPRRVDALAPWASVSKPLTAFAVLMAAQDEELGLDNPGADHSPFARPLVCLLRTGGCGANRERAGSTPALLGELISATDVTSSTMTPTLQVTESLELNVEIVELHRRPASADRSSTSPLSPASSGADLAECAS